MSKKPRPQLDEHVARQEFNSVKHDVRLQARRIDKTQRAVDKLAHTVQILIGLVTPTRTKRRRAIISALGESA